MLKKSWIPVIFLLIGVAIGATLWGQHIASQEPIKFYPAIDAEPAANSQPKPPPPGETYETGHWHGDEWHSEPHDTPAEVPTPEAQAAQIATPTPEELEIMQMTSEAVYKALYEELNKLEKGSQAYNELAKKIRWFEKNEELSDRRLQVAEKLGAALEAATAASETDEETSREWNRILAEMEPEMLEAERLYQDHQKQNPLEQ